MTIKLNSKSEARRENALSILHCAVALIILGVFTTSAAIAAQKRKYNDVYTGDYLNRVAFPLGGIGAGMICLEGTGALSHFSICNRPDVFSEPMVFSALCLKGDENIARVLEGPVPSWKVFGTSGSGNGRGGTTYGLPHFGQAGFKTRFPFGTINLVDAKVPLKVQITGFSPFIPGDADNSSLPTAALEYRFTNQTGKTINAVYSFNSRNFLEYKGGEDRISKIKNGFVFSQMGSEKEPWRKGAFAVCVDNPQAKVNCAWFRGGWFDPLTMIWKGIEEGNCLEKKPVTQKPSSPGASISVPLKLAPGREKTITVMLSWYFPETNLRFGKDPEGYDKSQENQSTHKPWYSAKFAGIEQVVDYWRDNYSKLRRETQKFSDCFYDTTLPGEVVEAVAANLTILKSPTVLRQTDGRLWCFEGCSDDYGCCYGSCTHVWNYAQAICHLFPDLERSLRQTEFNESQDERGHQVFRSALPIRPIIHDFHSAADGQLGGIIKVYRDWRICGSTQWLRQLWHKVKQSLDYCIETWDPGHKGILEEPHHNTYDIEYWGPDGHCSSFYLAALKAAIRMGKVLGDDVELYTDLFRKGQKYVNEQLFNGEYFYQKIQWQGLQADNPTQVKSIAANYSPEALELLQKEGPKYQYGKGCLSDGVLGVWMAWAGGLDDILDEKKIASHLRSVHKYNLKKNLSQHTNPQRPSFALGSDGGLLLCTWPKGGKLSLPFIYSNEVWTGIEYQAASHLIAEGMVEEGLEIVRTCRDRYDGRVRNPFNEYECGHWYARAMSSYALIQALTGVRYDAVDKTLYIDSKVGSNFKSFLSTATGFGSVGLKNGRPFVEIKRGELEINSVYVSGRKFSMNEHE